MPKSRNKKNQKKRSQARTQRIKNQQVKAKKELIELFQKAQEESLQEKAKQTEADANVVVEDLDIGDNLELEIDEEEIKE